MSKVTYTPAPPAPRVPGTFTVEMTEDEAAEVAFLLGAVIGGNTFKLFDSLSDALNKAGVPEPKAVEVTDRLLTVRRVTY
jgi:hypothetical protein